MFPAQESSSRQLSKQILISPTLQILISPIKTFDLLVIIFFFVHTLQLQLLLVVIFYFFSLCWHLCSPLLLVLTMLTVLTMLQKRLQNQKDQPTTVWCTALTLSSTYRLPRTSCTKPHWKVNNQTHWLPWTKWTRWTSTDKTEMDKSTLKCK